MIGHQLACSIEFVVVQLASSNNPPNGPMHRSIRIAAWIEEFDSQFETINPALGVQIIQ